MRSRYCECLCIPVIVARQQLSKNPLIVAGQRLGIKVTAVTNTHATIEELLCASFPMWPVSYQGK
jgi:predicted alpha/beta-hydrolase family hydrolase